MDPSIRALFHPEPGLTYLDTATYGLPPDPTLRAMREAEDAWRAGTANWVEWDRQAERARAAFGRLIGAPRSRESRTLRLSPDLPNGGSGIARLASDPAV